MRPETQATHAPSPSGTRRKIKVLFFESGRQGGSVLRLLSILNRLDLSRFETGVVSYYGDRAAASLLQVGPLFCRRSLGVPWYPQPDVFVPVLGLPVPTPFGIYLFAMSLTALWRHRPDVAFINSGVAEFAPAILAARLLGTRVVCALRMSRRLDAHEVRLAGHAQHLVACSKWAVASYGAQVGGRPPATCVYDGIDLDDFDARASEWTDVPLGPGPLYVCQVGSLIDRKRPLLAIEALDIARRRAPDLRLVLVGDGPLRPDVEALIRARGLQAHVLLLGARRDVPALLRRCHIGLLLSTDEGLPNAVLEYMASSLPVVTVRLPFIDELVGHEDTGLVVDDPTPEAIAAAILALARSPESRQRLGKASRARIEGGDFDPDREARDIERLLASVAEGRRASVLAVDRG